MKRFFFATVIITLSLELLGCKNTTTTNTETHYETIEESQESSIAIESSTEMPSTEKELPTEKDYSVPEEFVDYRKFIGENISVLNVDTSTWDAYDFTHELWRGSFYGHNGNIDVRLGWDNETIVAFFLSLDDTDKLSDSDTEMFDSTLQNIFGSTIEETAISYIYSGKDEYEFDFPKPQHLDICSVSWNSNTLLAYMRAKPQSVKETETVSSSEFITKKEPSIGMTATEIKQSTWGEPSTINKTTTRYSVQEQWVYRSSGKTKYIYFENGIVTTIQE